MLCYEMFLVTCLTATESVELQLQCCESGLHYYSNVFLENCLTTTESLRCNYTVGNLMFLATWFSTTESVILQLHESGLLR